MAPPNQTPFFLPVLLSIAACSTSPAPAPAELHQGAYRPAPPVFRPSQDAPHTVGQPGHLKPSVDIEPNPRPTSVLPPSREPGLWAVGSPRGSQDGPLNIPTLPLLLGVHLPAADDTAEARLDTAICGTTMTEAMHETRVATVAGSWPRDVQRCIAARLYKNCAWFFEWSQQVLKEAGRHYDSGAYRRYAAMSAAAKAFDSKECTGVSIPDNTALLYFEVAQHWKQRFQRGGK